MAGLFEEIGSGIFDIAGNSALSSRLSGLGSDVRADSDAFAQTARDETQFKPFTVTTSGLGGTSTDANGSTSLNLSPEQQLMQDTLLGQSSGFFNQAAGDNSGREADIFERLRALQRPGEERDALSLENRLLGQGRLGVQTDAFGGTPEQLAMAKAVEESRNQSAVDAIGMGQQEQMQQAQLGGQFQQAGFNPQQNLLSAFAPNLGVLDAVATNQREGANLGAQLNLGGLQQQTNFEKMVAELAQSNTQTLGGIAGQVGQGIDSLGLFSGLFGA